ncbi:MAG: hypothetical protein ACYC09_14990 [Bacteroidota bacterium]
MKRLFIAFLYLVISLNSVFAQRTIRVNLEEMVSAAGMIVHGTVIFVKTEIDPQTGILSTFVTIDVTENLYGQPEGVVTMKMVAAKTESGARKLAEMPVFTPGEEIVVFFHLPSELGFTSPVGMGQGKFSVITDPKTQQKIVRNGMNNARLFSGLKHSTALAKTEWTKNANEPVTVSDLTATIRSLVTIVK